MCLVDCNKIEQKDDIICYKVVKNLNDVVFRSPFKTNTLWEIGKQKEIKNTSISNLKKYSFYKQKVIANSYMHKIYGCAYHTFSSEMEAKKYIEIAYIPESRKGLSILKCVIPKSSKYVYEGVFHGVNYESYKSYASQKLKPIEVIK